MGDHHQRPLELAQPLLQPGHHLGVQVVGGLVQDKHVAVVDQRGGQGRPLALPAGELPHPLFKIGDAQAGEDALGLVLPELPGLGGQAVKDLLQHGARRVEGRVLREIFQPHVGVPGHRTPVGLLRPRQDAQQGGLTAAVHPDDPQLLSPLQIERRPVQHGPGPVYFCDVFCGKQHGCRSFQSKKRSCRSS